MEPCFSASSLNYSGMSSLMIDRRSARTRTVKCGCVSAPECTLLPEEHRQIPRRMKNFDPDAAHRMSDPTTDYRSIEIRYRSSRNAFWCRVAVTIDTYMYTMQSLCILLSLLNFSIDKKETLFHLPGCGDVMTVAREIFFKHRLSFFKYNFVMIF